MFEEILSGIGVIVSVLILAVLLGMAWYYSERY